MYIICRDMRVESRNIKTLLSMHIFLSIERYPSICSLIGLMDRRVNVVDRFSTSLIVDARLLTVFQS